MKKRIVSVLLCATLLCGLSTGCGNQDPGQDGTDSTQEQTKESGSQEADSGESAGEGEDAAKLPPEDFDPRTAGLSDIFPLEEPITLTYLIRQNDAMAATMETYADVEFLKRMEELTNVHIEWNHNTSDEAFALMISSKEYPDLINWPLMNVAGGPGALIEDGVIMDLTELIPQYAPNYYAWLQNNPEQDMASRLDDGTLFSMGCHLGNWETMKIEKTYILGPQIRQDWLDNLNLKMPTTTDELYDVLVAFKENDCNGNGDPDDEIPYVIAGGDKRLAETMYSLAECFGTTNDFCMNGDEIVFGPITDNYKEFLTYMNRLYTEGLINSDFAVNEDSFNLILQDQGGFTIDAMNSGVVAAHDLLKSQDETYNYVSGPWLTGPDGQQVGRRRGDSGGRMTAISTTCKYPEIALAWLDYAYSYAGSQNATFGIEGESYDVVDGYPTIKEEVKTANEAWNVEENLCRWMVGSINYPCIRDIRFYEQMNLVEDYQKDIQKNWGPQTEELGITMAPAMMTAEESSDYSDIMADIKTYVNESSLKFITGQLNLEGDWDSYVANIEKMNIGKAKELRDAALARFNNRK